MPIVDVQVHVAHTDPTPESFAAYMAANVSRDVAGFVAQFSRPERFVELLDDNGVDYACVLAEVAPAVSGVATNEYVRDFCAASPRLLPVATVNPYVHERPARLLRHGAADRQDRRRLRPRLLRHQPRFLSAPVRSLNYYSRKSMRPARIFEFGCGPPAESTRLIAAVTG